ncbi:MAG: ABC transporter substrate-binding protein [Litorilinea sp.]
MKDAEQKSSQETTAGKGRFSRRRFLRGAAAFGASATVLPSLLAACTQPGAAPGAAPVAADATAAPAAELVPTVGGDLTWAISQDPVNLVPYGAVNTSNHWGKEFMYDSLVEWDKDLIVQPALAESWETPDETTYIFHLREGVTFHNGDPVTAADVKYSIETQAEPPAPGIPHSFYPAIESVDIIDEQTVQFNMTGPDPTVEGYLAWGRYSAIIPTDAYERWNLLTEGVGTGPFKLIEYIPNDRVEYERNEEFWNPDLPYLNKLTLKVLPDESAAVAALRSGEIHGMSVTADTARTLENDPNIKIVRGLFSAPRVLQFTIKGEGMPWEDVRVRQAISKALDRQSLINNAFGGEAVLSGPIPPGYGDWFIPEDELLERWFTHDIDAARALMAEAGYEDGFDITLYAIANHDATLTAEVVQEQMRAININVNVIAEEIGGFAQRVGEGTFDWCSTGRGMRPDPTRYVNDFGEPTVGQASRWFNNGDGWSNDELVGLYQEALVNLDGASRRQQIRRIQEIILDEVPHVYVCQPLKFHAVNAAVHDMYVAFNDFHTGLRTTWMET